jgi:hypothetical protein
MRVRADRSKTPEEPAEGSKALVEPAERSKDLVETVRLLETPGKQAERSATLEKLV